jgi:hypothetical protein
LQCIGLFSTLSKKCLRVVIFESFIYTRIKLVTNGRPIITRCDLVTALGDRFWINLLEPTLNGPHTDAKFNFFVFFATPFWLVREISSKCFNIRFNSTVLIRTTWFKWLTAKERHRKLSRAFHSSQISWLGLLLLFICNLKIRI